MKNAGTDTAPDTARSEVPPRATIILVTLILGAFVANINLSIANVALPDIGRDLGASTTQQTAVASMFTLGLASSVLYLGAIGDRYGRRRLLLLGAALTIPAGLASAYAPTVELLIGARFVAGLAAGLMFPTTLSLISAMWRGAAKTKAIALWSGIGGGAASLGGVVGGALLEVAWWGSVFLFALPIAAVVYFLAARYVPADSGSGEGKVDNIGGVLSVIGVAAIVTAVQLLPNGIDAVDIGLFLVAVVAIILFYIREKHATSPLVDLSAASVPPFWVAAVAGTITFGCLMGALFLGQQFTQNVLGYDTLNAALVTLPSTIFMVGLAPLAGRMVNRRGSRFTLLVGLLVVAVGFALIVVGWRDGASVIVVLVTYGVIGAGVSISVTPAAHALMASLPGSRGGMGSAFTDLTRDFGGAIMQSAMGAVLAIVYANYFTKAFADLPPAEASQLSQSASEEIIGSFQGAQSVAESFPQVGSDKIIAAASEAFTEGKSAAYALAVVLILLAVGLVAWKYPKKTEEDRFFAEVELATAAEEAARANASSTS